MVLLWRIQRLAKFSTLRHAMTPTVTLPADTHIRRVNGSTVRSAEQCNTRGQPHRGSPPANPSDSPSSPPLMSTNTFLLRVQRPTTNSCTTTPSKSKIEQTTINQIQVHYMPDVSWRQNKSESPMATPPRTHIRRVVRSSNGQTQWSSFGESKGLAKFYPSDTSVQIEAMILFNVRPLDPMDDDNV
jgi:hypothetical protein